MTMSTTTRAFESMLSQRTRNINISGIRRVFELGAKLEDPINFSIGQPDFPVPDAIKQATISAIQEDRNGYTLTQGDPRLLARLATHLQSNVGWDTHADDMGLIVTSGTSGALLLAFAAVIDPGDEVIMPDPFFVVYPAVAEIIGAKCVYCDTYPDLRMTADRIEPLITDRTKMLLVNSPSNPGGVVLTDDELRDLVDLCTQRGVLLVSDEIYDEFTFEEGLGTDGLCPSPARFSKDMVLIRGFGKTYGCTGWRMGYAAGPKSILMQMQKMQQYTFVCAPSMAQAGMIAALDVDMTPQIRAYQNKRDRVMQALSDVAHVNMPHGAFYAFVEVPAGLGMTGTEFAEKAIDRNLLMIPGGAFSQRDTHVRLSFATSDAKLDAGLSILRDMFSGREA